MNAFLKGFTLIWISLAILGLNRACADGKVFPAEAVAIDVRIPGQRALLVWQEGRERLAIDTQFVGEGTNFAWVVPLPSAPRVEVTTRGIFPTLAWQTGPVVVHRVGRWFGCILAGAGVAWLALHVKRGGAPGWSLGVAQVLVGIGIWGTFEWSVPGALAGLALVGTSMLAIQRIRTERPWLAGTAMLGVLVLFLFAMLLPALATAGGGGASSVDGGVRVVDRQEAGIYETTTLQAADSSALIQWLGTNGYRISPGSEPVIQEYIRDGWVFVASRVRRDAHAQGNAVMPPLVFDFPSREPVYPLRLTGVGNGPLDLELFVLGPARAVIPGFRTLDARPAQPHPKTDEDPNRPHLDRTFVHLAHPELARLAPDAQFSTRLTATLSPDQMKSDALIQWDGIEPARTTRYSRRGALLTVTAWVCSAVCVLVLGMAVGQRVRPWRGWTRLCGWSSAATLALGLFALSWLPVVPVRVESRFTHIRWLRSVAVNVRMVRESTEHGPSSDLETVRTAIQRAVAAYPAAWPPGFREEDSPRNYRVRSIPGDVEVVYYDDWGREHTWRWSIGM